MSVILGVSGLYHDAAAALVVDGSIVAAAEEERFSRRKHDDSLPSGVVSWLKDTHLTNDGVDYVVFYERPLVKLDRATRQGRGSLNGFRSSRRSLGNFAKNKMLVEAHLAKILKDAGVPWSGKLFYADHHLSHAASAFYPSRFESSAVLCLDGVGEWASSSIHKGYGSSLDLMYEGSFPHSFGLFYAAMTQLAGFKVNSGEYKLMGLAPYGSPRFVDILRDKVINVSRDGSVTLDLSYFSFVTGEQMASDRLAECLWGGTLSEPMADGAGEPTTLACDIAASAQVLCNEVLKKCTLFALEVCGGSTVALAGGVSLNSVAVGRLLQEGVVEDVFVQPAASDAGGALGCALQMAAQLGEMDRTHVTAGIDSMRGAFLSYKITEQEVLETIERYDLKSEFMCRQDMDRKIATMISEGKIVGVCRDTAEFGPRALGNRSILASAQDPETQTRLNMAIKQRESFRPFAPAVLLSEAPDWFETPYGDQFMTTVVNLRQDRRVHPQNENGVLSRVRQVRSAIPAVTHIDYTARVQLVTGDHPLHGVLDNMLDLTGSSVIVNTSFNRRGEPIVRTALEGFECFARTDMDAVVLGDHLVMRTENIDAISKVAPQTPERD